MTAIVEINGKRAVVKDYHWSSADEALATMLNALLNPNGPSGADPNPDGTAAEEAVKRLGGRIISVDETESEDGVVY